MNTITKLKNRVKGVLQLEEFPNLKRSVFELNNVNELKKVFSWHKDCTLNDPRIYSFQYTEDINERRIRDAESIATVAVNIDPNVCLEIGTAEGHGTALIATNAPQATVYTVNIPPEEAVNGQGGENITKAYELDQIGSYYKTLKISNIKQILANTASWVPDIGLIDFAYIDGCHDTEFVYNDTKKILENTKRGSFVLWHDFNLNYVRKYHWINSVCNGVEKLIDEGLIKGRIYQIKDSWVGIYQVE